MPKDEAADERCSESIASKIRNDKFRGLVFKYNLSSNPYSSKSLPKIRLLD